MELIETEKLVKMTFSGTYDLAEYIKKNKFKDSGSKEPGSDRFCPYSWEETIKSLETGWTEGDKIKVNADSIKAQGLHNDYSVEYAITGDFLDVGTYLSGQPECWGSIIEEPKAMKHTRIFVDFSTGYNTPSHKIENRGSAIIALVDSLRETGHYVEITLAARTHDAPGIDKAYQFETTFETDNSYSRDALTFCTAHPGMLRRVFISTMERYAQKPTLGTYGTPKSSNAEGYDIVFGMIHLDSGNPWETMTSTTKHINKIIEANS